MSLCTCVCLCSFCIYILVCRWVVCNCTRFSCTNCMQKLYIFFLLWFLCNPCVCVCVWGNDGGEWSSLNKTERDRKRQRERERAGWPPGAWSAATWWRLKRPREGFLFFSPSLQIGLCDRPTSLFFCSNTRLQLWASVISELKGLKVCFIILVAKQLKVWQHLGSCLISCGWLLSANTVEQVCILWLCLLWGSNISTSSEHTSFRCSKADW